MNSILIKKSINIFLYSIYVEVWKFENFIKKSLGNTDTEIVEKRRAYNKVITCLAIVRSEGS